jgi:hypothetical protein
MSKIELTKIENIADHAPATCVLCGGLSQSTHQHPGFAFYNADGARVCAACATKEGFTMAADALRRMCHAAWSE